MKLLPLILSVVITGCPKPSVTPVDASGDAGADDSDADVDVDAKRDMVPQACARMATAGCPEGTSAHCVEVLRHVLDSGLTKVSVNCLAGTKTQEEVRKCGVACKTQ